MTVSRSAERGGLVIVTGEGPEHRFVARRLAAAHRVRAILLCDPPPRRAWHRVLRQSPVRFLDKALWRIFLRIIGDNRARDAALADVLGPEGAAFPADVPRVSVGRPKAGRLAAALAELAPDIVAIYGTGLVPDAALLEARRVALNLHTGLSPRYRGAACAFWPIHNNEPDWVGATVHECTSALDGGRIFATRRAPVFRGDDLHRIFARAVRTGADAYAEVVGQALAGPIDGTPQDLSQGREYPGAARGFASEIRTRWRLARMQPDLAPPPPKASPAA